MFGKDMNDKEWVTYMMLHYVKNNEDRKQILEDLDINESYFYGRNRKLGIKREMVIMKEETEDKPKEDKTYVFNILSGRFRKGNLDL